MIIKNKYFKNILLLCSFIILSLIFIYPLAKTNAVYFSDDMFFHLQRVREMATNANSGNFFVGIYTHTFGEVGYPLNLFYPWVTIWPFVLLSMLCSNQALAVYLGIAFYTFLTLCFTYLTVKKYSQNKTQAYITACLYAFSSYRVIDIFTRFALGEYVALTFLPLCLYGLYAIFKGNYRDWPYLAFGFSFVLLSHLLSVILISILLVALLVGLIPHLGNTMQRIKAFLKAIVVSILSSAIFIFPFIDQEMFQKYQQPDITDLAANALLPTRLLAESLNNNLNRVDSGNTYNLGIAILLVIICGLLAYHKLSTDYKFMYLLGVIFACLSTSLIPWSSLQSTSLSIIQFPWRFLGLATLLLSIVGGAIITQFIQTSKLNYGSLNMALGAVTIAILVPYIASIHQLRTTMQSTEQAVTYSKNGQFIFSEVSKEQKAGMFHLENYTPQRGQQVARKLCDHNVYINGVSHKAKVKAGSNQLAFTSNELINGTNIVLPVMNYKHLEVTDASGNRVNFVTDRYNRIKVTRAVRTTTLKVRYRFSSIDYLAVATSILTWLIAIVGWIYKMVLNWVRV